MLLRDFELTVIDPEDISLGKPVPWPVYDEFGKLLFKQGAIVRSERQMNILIKVGLYAKEIEEEEKDTIPQPVKFLKKINPFAEFDDLCDKTASIFNLINRKEILPQGQLEKRIYDIVTNIQGLYAYYPDAMLGIVHLPNEDVAYPVYHPLHTMVLVEMVLERLEVDQPTRLAILSAALTSNIAMNPYQQKLHQQRQPLKNQQLAIVQKHPEQGVAILSMLGITNKLWLETVRQHHELLDGSGYPRGLSGTQVSKEARILTLADVYSAMVTKRPYRNAFRHKESLRQLFLNRGKLYDERLTMVFLNELGIYPPGIYVRLANGELGVVVGKTFSPKEPLVASIKRSDGSLYLSPRRRNTSSSEFAIKATSIANEKHINPAIIWGMNAIRLGEMQDDDKKDPLADLF